MANVTVSVDALQRLLDAIVDGIGDGWTTGYNPRFEGKPEHRAIAEAREAVERETGLRGSLRVKGYENYATPRSRQ